ncbi:MAG: hypothetical protein QW330_03300, partial [Nitrososphaerota archaeon]
MASSKFRIFFASDIHGSEICFRKFINAADFYKAQILILGGDITGKFLAPIFEKGGAYEASFMNEKHLFNSADELEKFMQKLRDQGFYPYITTAEEWDELCRDEGRMLSVFNEVMRESVERWIRLAESGLKGILIGTIAGGLAPGGPYVNLPLAAALLKSGAGMGTMVAFVT